MKKSCIFFVLSTLGSASCEVVTKNEKNLSAGLQNENTQRHENDNEANDSPNGTQITVYAILDLTCGNKSYDNDLERIDVYVAPTCLHCGTFLVEDLQNFLYKHSQNCYIRIRLLPVSAKDLFVMKIIQSVARDENEYYRIYLDYIRRALATVKKIKPTERQQVLYKGSATDPEMIKYQAVASAFGFTDEQIVTAIPDMNAPYEKATMSWYKEMVKTLKPFCPNEELDLPLIIQNGKSYKSITDVPIVK